MLSETFGRQTLIAVALLAVATQALAQTRPIRGKVTDEQGRPVANAIVEVTHVSEAIVGVFTPGQRRGGGQKWQTKTNEHGDYIVGVSSAGMYLVTASKEEIGTDEIEVAVEVGRATTVNLRLWKAAPAQIRDKNCGNSAAITTFEKSDLAANAEDPALVRLLRWLEAVELHTPGCGDPSAIEVGNGTWSRGELETLVADLIILSKFLQMDPQRMGPFAIRSQVGSTKRQARLADVDPDSTGGGVLPVKIELYSRWFTRDEIEQIFHGNDTLRRGAVLHADTAVFVRGNLGRRILVDDGRWKGVRPGTQHWEIGRLLLDTVTPSPSGDAGALLWYRAVSAHLLTEGHLSEMPAHLDKARQIFPDRPMFLLDSAYLHQELSSPAIQAAVQQLRSDGRSTMVDSRRNELERAERFLRQTLALARDAGEARLRLGQTLGELGRHDEAVAELRTAIEADLDMERLYLAQLFLGRAEQALGQRDEARRRYEQAADLYPGAQSPRLALAQLARESGDRTGALRALQNVVARPSADIDVNDPWWFYYYPHLKDAAELMEEMRTIGSAEAR